MGQIFNSCCCFSLETGGLIIGWLNIIGGILGAIFFAIGIVGASAALNDPNATEEQLIVLKAGIVTFSIMLILSILYFIAGIFLNIGINKKKHQKMKMLMVMMVIGVVYYVATLFVHATSQIVLSNIISICISIYFFLCIYSLYSKIRDENETSGRGKGRGNV